MTSNPLFVPTAPTNSVPQPIMEPKSNSYPPPKVQYDQDYTPELTFKIPGSNPHTHQYSSLVEAKKAVKNEEHEEMARKIKSLKQSVRLMQGLGGHQSVSFHDLCMFPHVHLPIGFKTPKFEKYNGHGDPVAHLKRYCNRLRGARSKQELLMAYFGESLMGITSEWLREQAARVKPPMKESKMIDVFLQAQEPDYFHYLLSVVGKTFIEVIKIGETVENGIKFGKIISQASLKATTQEIKNGSGNLRGKKIREDVANVVSGTQKGKWGTLYQYAPPQFNHYLPMQDTQYSIFPSQYQGFEGGQRLVNNFTPIGESYTSLFENLKRLNMIEPIPQNFADPHSKGFNHVARCACHFDALGHSTEDCQTLKSEVEKMIQVKMIVVQNDNSPNVTYNPLPTPNHVHFIEMIGDDNSLKSEEKTIEIGGAFTKANVQSSG
ncbi:hypothetical protein KY290_036779 [Solanum tuberosum]|uniref:Retrotransposon gag domain-containing protein n=1 Tax=Solanum tuberosum TaxID=4113 RepID=A0ABQ7TV05_SOLTU|nr:hypothetical protein KY290_036779 [Solanum tuberosum]